ncbi:MAG TPA: type II toxin-antitoxin system HicA family toxin [Candidatus Hydrogenedentes bacterium]|nr:type II toxin-antitoxin system HicA family toxin [Candidatus Hydrogenedentota bacterium]
MGHNLPIITAKELVRVLERLGFSHRPLGGTSHRRYVHPDGRRTTVPFHAGHDIGRGLLRQILKDIDLTVEELNDLL